MKPKRKQRRSLPRRVSRIDLRKPAERRAIDALIALALHPASQPEPTDEDIDRFMREYDEGKHQLSKEARKALDEAGKRFQRELREHMAKTGNDIYG